MATNRKKNRVYWCLGICASAIAMLFALFYHGWNAHSRPSMIAGTWYLDDLRTDSVESFVIHFSSSGDFDDDPAFGQRWSYRNGKMYFRTWRLNDETKIARILSNTTLYSWFAKTDEFPLTAEFSEDGAVLTLTAEDTGPRCVLRRVKK